MVLREADWGSTLPILGMGGAKVVPMLALVSIMRLPSGRAGCSVNALGFGARYPGLNYVLTSIRSQLGGGASAIM